MCVLPLSCFLGCLVFVIVSLLFEFIIFWSWVWLEAVAESVHCLNVAALVRKEIQDETDRITGKSKQISPVPIHLSIFSPHGCALIHSVDFFTPCNTLVSSTNMDVCSFIWKQL